MRRSLEPYADSPPKFKTYRLARMLVARPSVDISEAPFGAVVARQLSVWPFAARTLRLFVLVDPSLSDSTLHDGLVRAMQQGYFRSDGCSQTRAVRDAALAAHYVLRHHNRDVLPLDQVNAATAVAAMRGEMAYVALAGDAAAFAWHDGALTGQRGMLRVARPLGLEQDPRITVWSTPVTPGDRLVLVCGAVWTAESPRLIEEILGGGVESAESIEDRLAAALGGPRSAGVMIVESSGPTAARPKSHLTLASSRQHEQALPSPSHGEPRPHVASTRARPRGRLSLRWLSPIVALALLGVAAVAAFNPASTEPQPAMVPLPTLDQTRVYAVNPAMAVSLGPAGSNVVDLAIGDEAIYTLDVVEASVRAFGLDGHDQQATPDTLLVHSGTPLGVSGRQLSAPVAIHFLPGAGADLGGLAIVDQTRAVVQVGRGRTITPRQVPTSASWRELGALGGTGDGHLYVLDSGAHRLLEYPSLNQRVVDPPRLLLEGTSASALSFEHAAEVLGEHNVVYVRMDDGTLRRFNAQGIETPVAIQSPDGRRPVVSGIAPDRQGGLFLADPLNGRVLHITVDGTLMSQFRDPALAGLRQIQSSLDGQRIYGLVAAGVLVFDLPEGVH